MSQGLQQKELNVKFHPSGQVTLSIINAAGVTLAEVNMERLYFDMWLDKLRDGENAQLMSYPPVEIRRSPALVRARMKEDVELTFHALFIAVACLAIGLGLFTFIVKVF